MKKLICAKAIEEAAKQGQAVCYVDNHTIVTPAARDAAKLNGIAFVEGAAPVAGAGCAEGAVAAKDISGGGKIDSGLIYSFLKMLLEKGGVDGVADLAAARPYVYDAAPNGLKVVRGDSVRMDVFDTGDPNVKAYYQELVSKEESKISAGFLVIDHSSFEWELTYEEIDYVIEGTLTVTLDGKTFTARAGDVLFVPSGSKVVWGSPDKARVFYATYPANWADLL